MPWLAAGVLVLRDDAIEIVGELLRPHGELLPLECTDARLAIFTAGALVGALDEMRSDVVRFSSGRIMSLRKLAVRTEAIADRQAFKLAEVPNGDLYLTEQLVERIRDTGLTSGTDFTEVAVDR